MEAQITEEDGRHLPRALLTARAQDGDAGVWGVLRYSISGSGTNQPTVFEQERFTPSTQDRPPHPSTHARLMKEAGGSYLIVRGDARENKHSMAKARRRRQNRDASKRKARERNKSFDQEDEVFTGARVVDNTTQIYDSSMGFDRKRYRTHREASLDPGLRRSFLGEVGPFSLHETEWSKQGRHDDDSPPFVIDPVTGTVSVTKSLDRDPPYGRASYTVTVTATDGELEARATVTINLKDINDNPPTFASTSLQATVLENSPRGTVVALIPAVDRDDPLEGGNAVLRYSLPENAVESGTASPVFEVDTATGRISTAVCCLDRERTARYTLALEAVDGGGLKGWCQVTVMVGDVNDEPPVWGKEGWALEVEEGGPPGGLLATLHVRDPDLTNQFAYRVVPDSGPGWQLVQLTAGADGSVAELRAIQPLDYEKPEHRQGLSFLVQVTDQGPAGWEVKEHSSVALVAVTLLDINDNSPTYEQTSLNISVPEDVSIGTVVARLPATDADQGSNGDLHYLVRTASDPMRQFTVDEAGTVRLVRRLDREAASSWALLVEARDRGTPPRTALATLTVSVTDVNDNPPELVGETQVRASRAHLKTLALNFSVTDPDDWQRGNGPPFTVFLDPRTPRELSKIIHVAYRPDSAGSGAGTIRLASSSPTSPDVLPTMLTVPLVLVDSGTPRLTATVPVTISFSDGDRDTEHRSVTVFHIESPAVEGALVPLGRVVVHDLPQRTRFSWASRSRKQRPFVLNTTTGELWLHGRAPPGRYSLTVSLLRPERRMGAVALRVRAARVKRKAALTALPLDVAVGVNALVDDRPSGSSLTTRLEQVLTSAALDSSSSSGVEVTTVAGVHGDEVLSLVTVIAVEALQKNEGETRVSRVWLMAQDVDNFDLLVQLKKTQVEEAIGSSVVGSGVSRAASVGCHRLCDCCCRPRVIIADGFRVVEARTRTFVGPTLKLDPNCRCMGDHTKHSDSVLAQNYSSALAPDANIKGKTRKTKVEEFELFPSRTKEGTLFSSSSFPEEESSPSAPTEEAPYAHAMINKAVNGMLTECHRQTCYNGGRCLPSAPGFKCVCPEGSHGPRCKILSRSFYPASVPDNADAGRPSNGSWAWLPPLNPCFKMNLSLLLLTKSQQGVIASSWSTKRDDKVTGLSLSLKEGCPHFQMSLRGTFVSLTSNASVSDMRWHLVEVFWTSKKVEMIIDNCIEETTTSSIVSQCRVSTLIPGVPSILDTGGAPLQLGHAPSFGSPNFLVRGGARRFFSGCVNELRLNGELYDLGHSVLGQQSWPGCPLGQCKVHGTNNRRCYEAPGREERGCALGWGGEDCEEAVTPFSFGLSGFLQVGLHFTPDPRLTSIELRLRSLQSSCLVAALRSGSGDENLVLELRGGRPCLSLSLQRHATTYSSTCLPRPASDGEWHSLAARRYGSVLELSMDDGDGDLHRKTRRLPYTVWQTSRRQRRRAGRNATSPPTQQEKPMLYTSFKDGCLADLRVSGHSLPLDPAGAPTPWGAVEASHGVLRGCDPLQACVNVTCPAPLTCSDKWKQYECKCEEGLQLSIDGTTCRDVDECTFYPCLHRGVCTNTVPGYRCSCPESYTGPHCEVSVRVPAGQGLTTLLASLPALLLLFGLFLVFFLLLRIRRTRGKSSKRKSISPSSSVKESEASFLDGAVHGDHSSRSVPSIVSVVHQSPLAGTPLLNTAVHASDQGTTLLKTMQLTPGSMGEDQTGLKLAMPALHVQDTATRRDKSGKPLVKLLSVPGRASLLRLRQPRQKKNHDDVTGGLSTDLAMVGGGGIVATGHKGKEEIAGSSPRKPIQYRLQAGKKR